MLHWYKNIGDINCTKTFGKIYSVVSTSWSVISVRQCFIKPKLADYAFPNVVFYRRYLYSILIANFNDISNFKRFKSYKKKKETKIRFNNLS